jgi:uncharacterized protein YecE (DUF72 family)
MLVLVWAERVSRPPARFFPGGGAWKRFQRLVERASGLGAKLGPVLLQLPPNLGVDLDALGRRTG